MRKVAVLLIFLSLASCSDKAGTPSGIIPPDTMKKILWDMIQADQYSALYQPKDSVRHNVKLEALTLYKQVFELHKVSRDEFRKSFQYYLDHPDLNRTLFDSLLAMGNRQRTDAYKTPKPAATAPPKPAATIPAKPAATPSSRPAPPSSSRPPAVLPPKQGRPVTKPL